MSLQARKLSVRYGDKWVLRDIDFDAERGQILGILGATAAGKSALVSTISGKHDFSGELTLDGKPLSSSPQKDGTISIVGYETGASERGLFRKPRGIASGERLFEAFEKACRSAARVILLDGIFDGMDRELQNVCLKRLMSITVPTVIIVFSTSFELISQYSEECLIISDGYGVQTGSPESIYAAPETIAAARLTGEVNLIEARRLTSTNADLPEFQTINGGHRIIAGPVAKSRLGAINQSVFLAIRPELVTISMGASFPEDNLLRSVVTGISFHGSTSIIEFDANGLKLTARVFRVVGLNVGDECMLGLAPSQFTILTK